MVGSLLLCLAAGAVHAEPNVVVSFQEGVNGYTGTADTYLDNDSATPSYNTANYGGFGWLRIGRLNAGMQQAGMVRFDNIIGNGPGQIPPGATIVSATLRMTAFAVKDHTAAGGHHYANPMRTSWVEGSVTREESFPFYSVPEEGASCADYRHYRASGTYAPGDHWGTSGNPNTNGPVWGEDIEITMQAPVWFGEPAGSDTFPTVGGGYDPEYYPISDNYWNTNYGTMDIDYDVTESVQAMVDGTVDNNGWWMQTHYEHDHLYYFTSEYGDPGVSPNPPPADYLSYRPELLVELLVCGHPSVPYPAGDVSGADGEPDCYTNIYDLMAVADQWLQSTNPGETYLPADIDQSRQVEAADFALMGDEWKHCTDPLNSDCDQYWRPDTGSYFADRSAQLGLGLGGWSCAAWGDYNRDGDVDLCVNGVLWRNNNGDSFTEVQADLGAWITAGIFGDCDDDGNLDWLSLANRVVYLNTGGGFNTGSPVSLPTFTGSSDVSLGASWSDYDRDGDLDLYISGHTEDGSSTYPDRIFKNTNGSFSVVWTQSPPYRGRGVAACDFDEDGDMDTYVSDYNLYPNLLWLNEGGGGFTDPCTDPCDVAAAYGVAGNPGGTYPNGHTIGSAWGDIDNDGHFDLFIANFRHPWGDGSQDYAGFYRNLGPGSWHFTVMFELDGADWQESYACAALADCDNDGDLDLYLTTVYDETQTTGGVPNYCRLYRNDGEWNFTDVTGESGLGGIKQTYQAAWADFDEDGDLDLATGNRLWVNQGNSNHWLKIRLQGDGSAVNLDAIGAQVRIDLGGKTLTRQVESSTGSVNQNDMTVHFGLGARTAPVSLEVCWPNGTTQIVENVTVDQQIDVQFGGP